VAFFALSDKYELFSNSTLSRMYNKLITRARVRIIFLLFLSINKFFITPTNLFSHVFSLKGCALPSSAWKKRRSAASLFFGQQRKNNNRPTSARATIRVTTRATTKAAMPALLTLLLLLIIWTTPLCMAAGHIILDKETYGLDETVKIRLANITADDTLSIISEQDVFKYSGELKSELDFYPQETGNYIVRLGNDGNTIDEKSFTVAEDYEINAPDVLYTDKKEYLVNEPVLIYINAKGEYELTITSETDVFKYLGVINSPLSFIPSTLSQYKVELRKDFIPIATTEFSVGEESKESSAPRSNITNITDIITNITVTNLTQNFTQPEANASEANASSEANAPEASVNQSAQPPQSSQPAESIEDETVETTAPEIPLPFNLMLKDKKGALEQADIHVLKKAAQEYDLEISPRKAGIRKIRFNNFRMEADKSFELDEVPLKREELEQFFKEKKIIKSFFIDTSGLNYTNGSITRIATGKELWKCKEWYTTQQACIGAWQKIMDLTPGAEYEIIITPEDPAYAETGVAGINTKKPIYHQQETANIIIAVLDTAGHLVSNADITLSITAPDNQTTTLSTRQGEIAETSRGIYESSFQGTLLEGNYALFAVANGAGVNTTMQSNFEVKAFYEFDIIRDTPVTTDPWQGPFQSAINIIPYINITKYDFTEILPSELLVISTGSAEQRTIGNQTFLTWKDLTSNATIIYSAQPPLITPNLYSLGKSFITYVDEVIKIFTEARLWHIVIDPAIRLFYEDFEDNWGCTTAGAPAAGDNCSRTPWGNFNGCFMPSQSRFCTSDDGAEGSHTTYAIQMTNFTRWNETRGIFYWFDPRPYDDIIVNGSVTAASLDNAAEFCRIWAKDSNSSATIYQCSNGNACEVGDTTPDSSAYYNFSISLSSLAGINLSEANISVYIGANHSNTADYCFWDKINITGIAYPPNVTNLTNPPTGSIATTTPIQFNFTVKDSKDPVISNCTLWANFTGSWMANITIFNITNNTITNITLEVADGSYIWNIRCKDSANLTDDYTNNYTLTIDAKPPLKTVNRVSEDTAAPWETIDRTPWLNVSLNKNASCRLSLSNESYADMSNDNNCTGNGTIVNNCTYNITELTVGNNYLYIACNDTSGHADTTSTLLAVLVNILCDSHTDCPAEEYCNSLQNCTLDVIPGYSCEDLAYGGGEDNEVCGNGADKYCVNDSSYTYTGWYCTATATDCVYNDNGNSYAQNATLCIAETNDYRNCSASNSWSSLFDCAEQNDPYNQSATYHAGEYCGYYAASQNCTNGTSGGCTDTSTADCNPHIYNQSTTTCGSVLADCDLGCGAGCDPSNSTTPEIISGTCYYDKSCSNACAWSQSNEAAPDFCINDNDGGACAYNIRTDPSSAETCYWNVVCQDVTGASLTQGLANNLKADYCDYCNVTGNQSGQYSPTPNASCDSNCADSGTIYYDNGGTSADRSDDCNNGVSTTLSDTLTIGDVWNSTGPAYCNDTECDNDCGTMVGACNAGVCECTDEDNPYLIIISPAPSAWDNTGIINFLYYVNDTSSGIENCSLIINGSIYLTNTTIDESLSEQVFTQNLTNGTYNWSIRCYDNSTQHNMNQTSGRILGVDTEAPSINNPQMNGTQFNINQKICLNVSASDIYSGLSRVYATINLPGSGSEEVDLSDSQTTSCDSVNGNGIYSVEYSLVFSGTYNWTYAYADDNAANQNSVYASLTWNVTAGGNLTVNMTSPSTNLEINESGSNNNFTMICNATCKPGLANCTDIYLFAEYNQSEFTEITTSTTDLINAESNYSCGNLTQGGASCIHTFNITSGTNSGNHTWPIRCKATSSNSATTFSGSVNLTINDHPVAAIIYPENNAWINMVININASTSYDSDGSIANYLFDYDNDTAFTSPSAICNGASSNCTWNTTQQNQCENNSQSCYLRVTVTDDNGLTNSTYILLGFDTQGPTTTLDRPRNFENITTNTFTVNATSSDAEIGTVHTVTFEYRQDSLEAWAYACDSTTSPYSCTWDVTGLPDGNTYEFRAYSNDTLGNTGSADAHTNITIDRTPPEVYLENPANNNFTTSTTIIFYYNTTDATSGISNCSLIINGSINATNTTITETQSMNFTVDLAEGSYTWSINCTDTHGNTNSSETRNITIDTTGPTTTLDKPASFANIIDALSYRVNASATDAGIGNISTATFEYRKGEAGAWTFACSDNEGPEYNCTWDLTGFEDGNDYQVRVWANDTLGNIGPYDTRTDITIDNNPPTVTLISPSQPYTDGDGNLIFKYSAEDTGTTISDCSLIWNGSLNQTEPGPIVEGQEYQFGLNNITDGNYTWTINCTDSLGHVGTGGIRNITMNILYVMYVNVTIDNEQYEVGNQDGEDANITTNITDYLGGPIPDASVTNDIIQVYNLSEQVAPWWDTDWKQRKPIYISSSDSQNKTNITIRINITDLGGNITSCVNEIRVAHVTSGEVPVNIIAGDNSNYCYIAFRADVSANANNENHYFVYYNNSAAANPGYATFADYSYNIFFENFDGVGWTLITNANPSTECAGGYGNFNNCIAFSTSSDYAASNFSTQAIHTHISGAYTLVMDEWSPWNASRGIFYNFSALTACGGDACNDIKVTGYMATGSVDNTAEFCRVWARNSTTTTTYVTIYNCIGPSPACEFTGTGNQMPVTTANYTSFNQNLSSSLGLGMSSYIAVHIGGNVSGTGDECYYEDINITGLRNQYPNITDTRVGTQQKWINRSASTTNSNGQWSYLFETFNNTPGNYSTVTLGQKTNYTDTYSYTFFELIPDQTPPNVTLNSPPDGSEANSSVTFTYYVNDTLSSITNCSLIIDGNVDATEYSIQEGPVQNFRPRIPLGGWHNWSVSCMDHYNNTGISENWTIFIRPPDLVINSGNISFNNTFPREGENITINATIYNLGGSDAINITIQFWLGDPDTNGVQIGNNFTVNITEVTGAQPNITLNVSWIATGPGPFNFYVVVDPPTATNGSITELNETNNKNNKTIHVPAYNYFNGYVQNSFHVANALEQSFYYHLNVSNVTGNIFVADEESTVTFSSLQAIGRDTSDNVATNDFNDTDTGLNMSHYNDSIRKIYTEDTDTPKATRTMTIMGQEINNVPIINSTSVNSFVTGILWDMSNGNTEYNGTQDLVFVTQINDTHIGAYGTYDYEIRVPTNLKNYKGAGTNVAFYWEITQALN